jgi:hypothetical protein
MNTFWRKISCMPFFHSIAEYQTNFWVLESAIGLVSPIMPTISIEWILYTGLLPVLAWREGNIARSAKSIYIAACLGNKKISFPFSPHHPSYNKIWLSTKGASAISLMQWRTWINVLRGGALSYRVLKSMGGVRQCLLCEKRIKCSTLVDNLTFKGFM